MRRFLCFLTWCFLPKVSVASAEELTITYTYERPSVVSVEIGGEMYSRVEMPKAPGLWEAGEPDLPIGSARILLPCGSLVSEIRVTASAFESLGDGYRVAPAQESYPLSGDRGLYIPTAPDATIYGSSEWFPGVLYDTSGIHYFRGYPILVLRLHPVQYLPSTGELVFHRELVVTVTTQPGGKGSAMFRGLAVDEDEMVGRVDNVDAVRSYRSLPSRSASNLDLLIITPHSLAGTFAPLKRYHDTTGVRTEIVTTQLIGDTSPDAVRDYIRSRYLSDGISYVLLAGSNDSLPAPWARPSPNTDPDSIPTDMFFSCLDGTWDFNGDGIYGDLTDGPDGERVDRVAEVYVGRAGVDSVQHAVNFVNKTLKYLQSEDSSLGKALLAGESLGFGGVSEYATAILLELIDTCCAHYYCTYGIPSSSFTIDTLFDSEDYRWPNTEIIGRINDNVHLISHGGHAYWDYAMKLGNQRLLSLRNETPFFVYSWGCLTSRYCEPMCWAATVTAGVQYGAFAMIGNSGVGFCESGTTNGISPKFNRQFWDAVFSPEENKPELGRANADSKEDWLHVTQVRHMPYICYGLTLFGDPSVAIKKDALSATADTVFGWAPLTVSFAGAAWPEPLVWQWDFGDGGASDLQSPTHVYDQPGLYDIDVSAFTEQGTVHRRKTSYIAVLADSLKTRRETVDTTFHAVVEIDAVNHVPLRQMEIPIQYSGGLDLVLDSISVVDCRTAGTGVASLLHIAAASGLATILVSSAAPETAAVAPGSGPVVRLFFSAADAVEGQESPLRVEGYGCFEPRFISDYGTYGPGLVSGSVRYNGCCGDDRGDINLKGDGIDIADLVYLVNYMFKSGPDAPCYEKADIDGSSELDIADLVYLVNYMFKSGPPPSPCP